MLRRFPHVVTLDSPPAKTDAYRDRVIADGALLYFRLDETSGTTVRSQVAGWMGTITGGVTLNESGATGDGNKAMKFDGITSEIVMSTLGVRLHGNFTIEGWVRLSSAVMTYPHLCACLTYGGQGFELFYDASDYKAFVNVIVNGSPNYLAGTRVGLQDDRWHCLAAIRAGSVLSLYVDGVIDATSPILGDLIDLTATPFYIGSNPAGGGQRLAGWIDDVAIYQTALTPQQIADHYALAQPTPAPQWPCAVANLGAGVVQLTGRYRSGVKEATRVYLHDRVFHIDAVDNREERGVDLQLTCHEVFD